MALLDRFTPNTLDPSATARLPVHQFAAAMQGLARGSFTRDAVEKLFNLDAGDVDQMTKLLATYAEKGNAAASLEYIIWLERVLMLYERGLIDKQQVATLLEIT